MRIPRFKPGGVATRPKTVMAMVGEKGPEVVVHLVGTTDEIVERVIRELRRRDQRNGGPL